MGDSTYFRRALPLNVISDSRYAGLMVRIKAPNRPSSPTTRVELLWEQFDDRPYRLSIMERFHGGFRLE